MDFSGFFNRIELLIKSLELLDPDLLPPSFEEDLLSPLSKDQAHVSMLKGLDRYLTLMESILPLAETKGAWSDWEYLNRNLAGFLHTDDLSLFRQTNAGSFRIFPRSYETGQIDPEWPASLKDKRWDILKEKSASFFFLRFGNEPSTFWFLHGRLDSDGAATGNSLEILDKYGQWFPSLFRFLNRKQQSVPKKEAVSPEIYENRSILGEAPSFIESLEAAERASQTDAPIYLKGESGTGKELFAKRIHTRSQRSDNHFVAINCAAVPHELIESELFGHEKGAFTGAYYRKIGKAEIANGGTLFLDEIGEMPLAFQAKLLRFLQEKNFSRVGGNTAISSDARIIIATHRDLEQCVVDGTFREDLYYRVNVIPIQIPPLRNRHGDIRLLANHFFAKYKKQHRKSKKIEPEVFDFIEDYSFPGNVRELENLIHRVVVMSKGKIIKLSDLPSDMFKAQASGAPKYILHPFEDFDKVIPESREDLQQYREKVEHLAGSYVRDLERRFLYHVLDQADGKVRLAAELAGINRTLFYKLLKRAGIDIGHLGS